MTVHESLSAAACTKRTLGRCHSGLSRMRSSPEDVFSATMRTASLARDFQALAALVDPQMPCYLVVYIGDVQLDPAKPGVASATPLEVPREWVLISYVPQSCSSFEAKKMADNRAVLNAEFALTPTPRPTSTKARGGRPVVARRPEFPVNILLGRS